MSIKLKPKQRLAAMRLVAGESAAAIAKELKLRPETLSRWRRQPEFMALHERLMDQLDESLRPRLRHILARSLDEISASLAYKNGRDQCYKTALDVLKLVGKGAFAEPKECLAAPPRIQNVQPD